MLRLAWPGLTLSKKKVIVRNIKLPFFVLVSLCPRWIIVRLFNKCATAPFFSCLFLTFKISECLCLFVFTPFCLGQLGSFGGLWSPFRYGQVLFWQTAFFVIVSLCPYWIIVRLFNKFATTPFLSCLFLTSKINAYAYDWEYNQLCYIAKIEGQFRWN